MKFFVAGMVFILLFAAFVDATDVAYIVNDGSSLNSEFISTLGELGLSYTVIRNTEVSNYDFSEFKMILLNNEDFPNPEEIPVNDYPAVLVDGKNMDAWGWTQEVSKSKQNVPFHIDLVDLNHTITNGFTETDVQVYTSKNAELFYMNQYNIYSGITIVGSRKDRPTDVVIGTVPAGTVLSKDGQTTLVNANTVFFGISDTSYWTDETRQLFKNSIAWIIDGDGDGYIGAEDCDETNPNVNSGQIEIQYDGIDNDCNPATVDDPVPPVFTINPYTDPALPSQGVDITVYIQIDEPFADTVLLRYTVNGGIEIVEEMEDSGNGLFGANIGSYTEGDVISYYIWANDTSGNEAQTDVFGFTVAAEVIEFDLQLAEGYNLISIPLLVGTTNANDIFSSHISQVKTYSGGSMAVTSTVVNNQGYFVYSDSVHTETIEGIEAIGQQSVALSEGLNLIGITSGSNIELTDLPAEVIEVSKRNSDGSYTIATYYDGYGWFNPFELEPGKGYWFKADSAATWIYNP